MSKQYPKAGGGEGADGPGGIAGDKMVRNGTLEKKNCVIFYSCNPVRHVFGVGFYVNSVFLLNILRFEPVNDRLCWIRVHEKYRNYSIINAHAPTEDKDDEEKDKFYLELETVYSQCPRHDIKMVFGDFSTKVGKEESNYPFAGRNGLHEECNGNSYKLVHYHCNRRDYWGNYIYP